MELLEVPKEVGNQQVPGGVHQPGVDVFFGEGADTEERPSRAEPPPYGPLARRATCPEPSSRLVLADRKTPPTTARRKIPQFLPESSGRVEGHPQ